MLFNFVMLVLAVALGTVIGMGVLLVLMLSPAVLNWYMRKSLEVTTKAFEKMDV